MSVNKGRMCLCALAASGLLVLGASSPAPVVSCCQLVQMKLSSPTENDGFGANSDIDGNLVIVGTPGDDTDATDGGAAYLFDTPWTSEDSPIQLIASDVAEGDQFGGAVAIDGDYVVVGARTKDDGKASNVGAAYVFYKDEGGSGNWGQQDKLTPSGVGANDLVGGSVAISGDFIIIGAAGYDGDYTDMGAAWIFERTFAGWSEVARLEASDAAAGDGFGLSVGIDGNYAVVGAWLAAVSSVQTGAAYTFFKDEGGTDNWGEQAKLTASDATYAALFGVSAAIDGDNAVIGAMWHTHSSSIVGAAYVYGRNQGGSNNWGEVDELLASDRESGDAFGNGVAIDGSYIAIVAPGEDSAASGAGAAYVFEDSSGWSQLCKVTASDAAAGDALGNGVSVGISGVRFVCGAQGDDIGAVSNAGSAYVFSRDCP